MSRSPLDVVCDAGPLIHLDELGCLDLLTDFRAVLVPDAILLTDDAAARLAAKGLGYRVHGSIGILLRAIRRQQRAPHKVLFLLRDLPLRSTLHIRPDMLEEIVARVESEIAG